MVSNRIKGTHCHQGIRDQDTLVLAFFTHVDPCTFRDCEDMGRVLISTFTSVLVNDRIRIERKVLVRIDGN